MVEIDIYTDRLKGSCQKVTVGGSPVTINCKLKDDGSVEGFATSQIGLCDLNADQRVNTFDYRQLADKYAQQGQNLPEDINGDGTVNAYDLSILIKWIGFEVP